MVKVLDTLPEVSKARIIELLESRSGLKIVGTPPRTKVGTGNPPPARPEFSRRECPWRSSIITRCLTLAKQIPTRNAYLEVQP